MGLSQESKIENRFEALIQELTGSPRPIPWDENLLMSGFVPSVHMLELVMLMEEHLGAEIDPFAITPESFESINAMARFVAGQSASPSHG